MVGSKRKKLKIAPNNFTLINIKKINYLIITDEGIKNLAFPLLAKKIIQPDSDGLVAADYKLSDPIKFSIKALILTLKIIFKKFRLKNWRDKILATN